MNNPASRLVKSGIESILMFLLFSCTVFAQGNQVPAITKTFTIQGPGNLEVSTSGGGITVEGQDGNQVEVQVFVRKNGNNLSSSDPLVAELKEAYDLTIEKNGNTVIASSKRITKNPGWNNLSISFHVLLPHPMSCDLKTSGGGISVSKLSGTQYMHTSGGGITLAEIKGTVKAYTSGGGIRISKQEGALDVHTSGGGITIEDAQGAITGHTSGGGIHLQNIRGDIDVHTSGGSIDISGQAAYVKARTSGGNIRVDIQGLDRGLDLQTSGGGIKANIPGKDNLDLNLDAGKVNIALKNFSGHAEKGKIVGKMNGGGIPVNMRASGGNIDIVY